MQRNIAAQKSRNRSNTNDSNSTVKKMNANQDETSPTRPLNLSLESTEKKNSIDDTN